MHLDVFVFGAHMDLQCFVHVQHPVQPLLAKLVFGYFDCGSCAEEGAFRIRKDKKEQTKVLELVVIMIIM